MSANRTLFPSLRTARPAPDGSTELPLSPNALDWLTICEVATAAFDRAVLFHHPDTDRRRATILQLMSIASGIREYALAGPEDLIQVWLDLRHNDTLIDTLLETASDIGLVTGYTLDEIASYYASMVHMAAPVQTQKDLADLVIADTAFMDSLGTREELFQLLQVNPWVLTILILRRAGRLGIVRPSQPAPMKEPATEEKSGEQSKQA